MFADVTRATIGQSNAGGSLVLVVGKFAIAAKSIGDTVTTESCGSNTIKHINAVFDPK